MGKFLQQNNKHIISKTLKLNNIKTTIMTGGDKILKLVTTDS